MKKNTSVKNSENVKSGVSLSNAILCGFFASCLSLPALAALKPGDKAPEDRKSVV